MKLEIGTEVLIEIDGKTREGTIMGFGEKKLRVDYSEIKRGIFKAARRVKTVFVPREEVEVYSFSDLQVQAEEQSKDEKIEELQERIKQAASQYEWSLKRQYSHGMRDTIRALNTQFKERGLKIKYKDGQYQMKIDAKEGEAKTSSIRDAIVALILEVDIHKRTIAEDGVLEVLRSQP